MCQIGRPTETQQKPDMNHQFMNIFSRFYFESFLIYYWNRKMGTLQLWELPGCGRDAVVVTVAHFVGGGNMCSTALSAM